MAFLSEITQTGTATVQTIVQHFYDTEKAKAILLFDEALELEVKKQLKINNIVVPDVDWPQYIIDHLTKATITDGNLRTHYILLDATVDGGTGEVTDFGTVLATWQGEGYTLDILSPTANIVSFE